MRNVRSLRLAAAACVDIKPGSPAIPGASVTEVTLIIVVLVIALAFAKAGMSTMSVLQMLSGAGYTAVRLVAVVRSNRRPQSLGVREG